MEATFNLIFSKWKNYPFANRTFAYMLLENKQSGLQSLIKGHEKSPAEFSTGLPILFSFITTTP
jgi:hypothetical protein